MSDPSAQIDSVAADQADVRASLGGDGDAFARIMRRHQGAVARLLWRFSRDPNVHGELVQDTFVSAYWSLASYSARAPLGHWLARIAVRTGYAFWRRRANRPEPLDAQPAPADPHPSPADELAAADAADRVQRLLAGLPPRDRLVLTLLYLDGRDVREVASVTGWSATMVKVQAWRARAKLKKLLDSAYNKEASDEPGRF